MISGRKLFVMFAFLSVLLSSCNRFRSDVNEYVVTVRFVGGESGSRMENVSAIVGSDKFWWAGFEKNEENTVTLFTKKNPSTNLTLLYTLNGSERSWESSDFSESDSYRISLEIDASGVVKESFCKMPCRL